MNHLTAIHIRKLDTGDVGLAGQLSLLLQQIFGMENPQTAAADYLQKLLARPDIVVFAALHDHRVVGGLTAYELPMFHADYREMFIYDIAVSPDFQGQGTGKKLIAALREYCRENGIRAAFVQALQQDGEAVAFYRATGGQGAEVIQFTYPTAPKI